MLAFLSVGIGLLYLVFRINNANYQEHCAQDGIAPEDCNLIEKLVSDFQSVDISWMFIVFLCFLGSNLSRAVRWRMLIEPLGKKPSIINLFFAVMVSYLANMGFPRIGEFVRAGLVARYEDLPVEKVMGTVVLDRLADLLIFISLFVVVIFLQSENIMAFLAEQGISTSSGDMVTRLGILAALGLGGVFVLYKIATSNSSNGIVQRIQKIILGFWEGIQSISKIKQVGWFIFHTVMIWVMFFCMTYFGFKTFDATAHLGPDAGLTAFVFGALGFVIPSPGGMGTYHFFMQEALRIYSIPVVDGFSFANIMFFSIQFGCNALFGIIGLILLPILNKK